VDGSAERGPTLPGAARGRRRPHLGAVYAAGSWAPHSGLNAWDVYWRPRITEQDIRREMEREDKQV